MRSLLSASIACVFATGSAMAATSGGRPVSQLEAKVGSDSINHALDQHTWRDRLLLVFAPDNTSVSLAEQRQIARRAEHQFTDRQLVSVEIVGDQVHGASDKASDLRQRYGVEADAFKAVLIGKDGGVKLRSATPLSANELERTIDAMPMRKQEASR